MPQTGIGIAPFLWTVQLAWLSRVSIVGSDAVSWSWTTGERFAERRVAAQRIVEALDVAEDSHPCLGLRAEATASQQLAFEGREEALGHGVVVGVANRAHRRTHARFGAPRGARHHRDREVGLIGAHEPEDPTAGPRSPARTRPSRERGYCCADLRFRAPASTAGSRAAAGRAHHAQSPSGWDRLSVAWTPVGPRRGRLPRPNSEWSGARVRTPGRDRSDRGRHEPARPSADGTRRGMRDGSLASGKHLTQKRSQCPPNRGNPNPRPAVRAGWPLRRRDSPPRLRGLPHGRQRPQQSGLSNRAQIGSEHADRHHSVHWRRARRVILKLLGGTLL